MHVDARDETEYLRAMNAVLREKHEVFMLTNEAIEAHLASLHAGQDDLKEDVRELRADNKSLRDKVDAVDEKLTREIRAVDEKLTGQIHAVDEKLTGEIRALDVRLTGEIRAVDARLNQKIDDKIDMVIDRISKLSEDVSGMRGMQKAMLWMMGIFGSLGITGKIFHWF